MHGCTRFSIPNGRYNEPWLKVWMPLNCLRIGCHGWLSCSLVCVCVCLSLHLLLLHEGFRNCIEWWFFFSGSRQQDGQILQQQACIVPCNYIWYMMIYVAKALQPNAQGGLYYVTEHSWTGHQLCPLSGCSARLKVWGSYCFCTTYIQVKNKWVCAPSM